MKRLPFVAVVFFSGFATLASPVLMISVDGLAASDLVDAESRGIKIPSLRALMKEGAYATGVIPVLPSITYPSHTTLITGVSPALHGISNNRVFDPLEKSQGEWYWYASDIKVPTLWDKVHEKGERIASLFWPVTLGADAIDFNVPEFWRTHAADEHKLFRAVSTKGLIAKLEKDTGVGAEGLSADLPRHDVVVVQYAAQLIKSERPYFTTIHLVNLDHVKHEYGPESSQARAALEAADAAVGTLVSSVRKTNPEMVTAIVSDHGFSKTEYNVNLMVPFVDAGLVTLDSKSGKVKAWKAIPWAAGGSAGIVLADPNDKVAVTKVEAMLKKLAADPKNGIAKVISKTEIQKLGGPKEASFFVDLSRGYVASVRQVSGPLVTKADDLAGMHGYFPDNKEMGAAFIIAGPNLKTKGSLGEVDMRDIAPTLAKILEVKLSSATGKPLF